FRRACKRAPIYAAALTALGAAFQVNAANLLQNPGFESPTAPPNTSSTCAFWTFDFDCQRATFANHTTGGQWAVWNKTFQPAGGRIEQEVLNASAGASSTLNAFSFFETTYPTTSATTQLQMIWEDSGGNPIGTPATLNIDPASN